VGLNILANSGPSTVPRSFGQIVGQSALQAQQVAQQSQTNALQRQLMAMQIAQGGVGLSTSLQRLQDAQAAFGGSPDSSQSAPSEAPDTTSNATPSVSDAAAPDAPPLIRNYSAPAPQYGASAQTAPPTAPPAPGPTQAQLDAASRYAFLSPNANPLDILQKRQEIQTQSAQRAIAPKLATYDDVVNSDSPTRDIRANPQLLQDWARYAPTFGIDPTTGLTDASARLVFGMAGNQIRASVNMPTQAPKLPLVTRGIQQVDPITGEVKHEEDLEKVVGPDGKPVLVPKNQAAGKTPYNQFSSASDDDLQAAAEDVANYKVAPPTGRNLLSGNWPAVMKLVKQINPNYDATQFNSKNKARMAFATGKQGDITRSLSVATDHLDQLSQAADALNNGGIPAANKVANFFSQQTGNPQVTNFNAMKEIVGDEVVKAVVGTGGASKDREAIKSDFSAANSPAQLQGVIQKYKGLMAGQLNGLRRQYEQNTGLKDFDSFISPTAQAELGSAAKSSAPAMTNAKGWTLHVDKNGNKAYVSPDGKSYELAK